MTVSPGCAHGQSCKQQIRLTSWLPALMWMAITQTGRCACHSSPLLRQTNYSRQTTNPLSCCCSLTFQLCAVVRVHNFTLYIVIMNLRENANQGASGMSKLHVAGRWWWTDGKSWWFRSSIHKTLALTCRPSAACPCDVSPCCCPAGHEMLLPVLLLSTHPRLPFPVSTCYRRPKLTIDQLLNACKLRAAALMLNRQFYRD